MAKPSAEQIEARLWNAGGTDVQQALLDQYKLYVEMADRISARRGLTNTFFLTLNSAIFTLFGVLWKDKPADIDDAIVLLLAAVALGQCAAWGILVRSYRLLNGAKYEVIGLMEKKLPASPYAAEWQALGEGGEWKLYVPLSHAESWVPYLFAAAYLIGAVILLAS
jgi:hypothetical protein